jgi:hypothetical protein
MLKKREKINITGESVIDENVVCTFSAVIDPEAPENMVVNQFTRDKDAYKAHREVCREDFAEFEDFAYARQAEILKAMAK